MLLQDPLLRLFSNCTFFWNIFVLPLCGLNPAQTSQLILSIARRVHELGQFQIFEAYPIQVKVVRHTIIKKFVEAGMVFCPLLNLNTAQLLCKYFQLGTRVRVQSTCALYYNTVVTGLPYHLVLLVSFLSVAILSSLEHYFSLSNFASIIFNVPLC